MTARYPLTAAQGRVLDAIAVHTKVHGRSPSYRQIAAAVGSASVGSVARWIDGLVERGALYRLPNRARTLAVVTETISFVLPRDLDRLVRDLAVKAGVTPEDLIIEAVRDQVTALCSQKIASRETSSALPCRAAQASS